jgi:hypothetical protein
LVVHQKRLARARPAATLRAMNKLCIFTGTIVLGYAGWYLGALLGFEFFGCFLVSSVGSVLGVWVGWKVAEHYR